MFERFFIHRQNTDKILRDTESRENKLEQIIALYMAGKLDYCVYAERVKEVNARFDLRRAGQVFSKPS